jgi:hypothetical protein
MKKLKSGLGQAVSSTLIGLVIVALVGFLTRKGLIPGYSIILLSIFNILASLLTMTKMRRWGLFYTFGWLAGAFIFNALGLLGTADFIFNIVVPIMILILRVVLTIKKSFRKVVRSR